MFGPEGYYRMRDPSLPFSDVRLTPHYPARSPLEDVLRLVAPGSDEYVTEKYAFEIETLLQQWSQALKTSVRDLVSRGRVAGPLDRSHLAGSRKGTHAAVRKRDRLPEKAASPAIVVSGRERFLQEFRLWLGPVSRVETAEFEITGIEEIASAPLAVRLDIRYDMVATRERWSA